MVGYKVKSDKSFDPDEIGNPKKQDIPFRFVAAELDYMVEIGEIERDIFAGKTMDVRLPAELVKAINHYIEIGEPFRLMPLTSRSFEEALEIFKASGVKHPEKVVFGADSGAILQIDGKTVMKRELSEEEQRIKTGHFREGERG